MLDMFFVHAEMRPPVTPTNWQAQPSITQPFIDVGWGSALEATAFVALQRKPLGVSDIGSFTAAPNNAQSQPAHSAATSAATTAGSDMNRTAPAMQTEVQRIAEQRMLLLAQHYAMRDDPKAESQKEVLARLKILNTRLASKAPRVTEAHVEMFEVMAQRLDERASRRAARKKEWGIA
jgi:hypothetical protein